MHRVLPIARVKISRDCITINFSEDYFRQQNQHIQPKIVRFLEKLSQYSGIPFKINSRIRSIETIILERIIKTRPITLTQFHAVSCDLTEPIATQTIFSESEILNCRLQLGKKQLGSINLPVFDGRVSGLVLADTIADRFVWQILDCFFKQTVYSELIIKNTESGIVVKRGDFTLAEGLTPSPSLRQQISEKITQTIFLQELWGAIDWQQHNLSTTSSLQALTVKGREWLGDFHKRKYQALPSNYSLLC